MGLRDINLSKQYKTASLSGLHVTEYMGLSEVTKLVLRLPFLDQILMMPS